MGERIQLGMEVTKYGPVDMKYIANKPRRPGKGWPMVRQRIAGIAAFDVGDSTPCTSQSDGFMVQTLNALMTDKLWRIISVAGVQRIIRTH